MTRSLDFNRAMRARKAEARLAIHCAQNARGIRFDHLQAAMTEIERLINGVDPAQPVPAETWAAIKAAHNLTYEAIQLAEQADKIVSCHAADVNHQERKLRRSAAQ